MHPVPNICSHSHILNNLNWSVAFAASRGRVRHCVPNQPTVPTALKCVHTVAVDILFFCMIRFSRTWGGWRGSQELRVDEKAVRYLGCMWRWWGHRVYLSILCTFMHTSHRRTWYSWNTCVLGLGVLCAWTWGHIHRGMLWFPLFSSSCVWMLSTNCASVLVIPLLQVRQMCIYVHKMCFNFLCNFCENIFVVDECLARYA